LKKNHFATPGVDDVARATDGAAAVVDPARRAHDPQPTPAAAPLFDPDDAFAQLASARRSVRAFLPDPVPLPVVQALLQTARQAPSGANLQPGHFWLVQGAPRAALTEALCHAHRSGVPEREDYDYFPVPMPMQLRKRQVAAAQALYTCLGVPRGDAAARSRQFERNYRFFDAPVAIVVTIACEFGHGGFMDLGMALHGLMLAAQSRGLASCAIGALASYPEVVRDTLCGLALGREDPDAPVNATRTQRAALKDYFTVLGEEG
jgi:nitroreductase